MTFAAPLAAASLLLVSLQTSEGMQESATIDPAEAAIELPIVVSGQREVEEERVQTGSRTRTRPVYTDIGIATSTGVAGLTPGSGMEPLNGANRINRIVTTTCVSDNSAVGEAASCLLLQARDAVENERFGQASDLYRYLVSSDEFTGEERLAGGTELYNLARTLGDEGLREEALIRLVDGEVLPEDRRPAARRTLADMALARGRRDLAIQRLEEHVALNEPDAQSLANLAILMRDEGQSGAQDIMRRAISVAEAEGRDVPQGWSDFAAAPDEAASHGEDELAVPQTVNVILSTELGDITIALETARAPITAGNFLQYVDEGRFDGVVFYRAMHINWGEQPNGLLQGGTQWDPERVLPGIPHEPTTTTGLSHTRGALSMAMGEPGTANGDFSIMLGDQRGLDANPDSPEPVWQAGYAVFGYVIEGMDVVEAIHAGEIDPDKGEGFMRGQLLAAPVTIIEARRAENDSTPDPAIEPQDAP